MCLFKYFLDCNIVKLSRFLTLSDDMVFWASSYTCIDKLPAPLRIIHTGLEIRFDHIGQFFTGNGENVFVGWDAHEDQPVAGALLGCHQAGGQVVQGVVVVVDGGQVV